MFFNLQHTDQNSKARAGIINTSHGQIETPVFMPVGTLGTVKAVHQRELDEDIRARIILGNTYHLYLRPGLDVIEQAGGLHRFINWGKPILTDSGGYQVFSLSENRKLTDEGVLFRSHIDGSKLNFTPENIVDIQRTIGADIIMALDECTPYPCEYDYAKKSMHLTHKWLKRGVKQFNNTSARYDHEQYYFPIVQGSVYKDLRIESAKTIAENASSGCAIGGLSVGEPIEEMYAMIDIVEPHLPMDKPRYLMGVGTPLNIIEAIDRGIDMFDCVIPTRNGRNGLLYTKEGTINIKNEKWKKDYSALEGNGSSYVDNYYSKAYVRHLFASNERLGPQIASIHNLAFYLWLVDEARKNILSNSYKSWKNAMVEILGRRL